MLALADLLNTKITAQTEIAATVLIATINVTLNVLVGGSFGIIEREPGNPLDTKTSPFEESYVMSEGR